MSKAPKPSKKARLTAARLAAVQVLYQQALSGSTLAEVRQQFLDHYQSADLDGDKFVAPDEALWLSILDGVDQYGWQLDSAVDDAIHAVQPDRKTENIDVLLKLILRCGSFELKAKQFDNAIIINDYVNVARAFYGGKEPTLVNGVLDRLADK